MEAIVLTKGVSQYLLINTYQNCGKTDSGGGHCELQNDGSKITLLCSNTLRIDTNFTSLSGLLDEKLTER